MAEPVSLSLVAKRLRFVIPAQAGIQ